MNHVAIEVLQEANKVMLDRMEKLLETAEVLRGNVYKNNSKIVELICDEKDES